MGIITLRSITFVLALLAILSMPAVAAWDLNGKWICKEGGTYFVRQVGDKVWWLGEPDGSLPNPPWCNVAQGTICGDYVTLNWADVPKGIVMNSGNLVLQVATGPDGYPVMNVICVTGGFGGRSFVTTTGTFSPPSNLIKISGYPCKIQWTDNSNDEEGFNIYVGGSCVNCAENTAWTKVASVGANVVTYTWSNSCCDVGECSCVMVRAYKGSTESKDSNKIMLAPVC